jgi:hypothetical protein
MEYPFQHQSQKPEKLALALAVFIGKIPCCLGK